MKLNRRCKALSRRWGAVYFEKFDDIIEHVRKVEACKKAYDLAERARDVNTRMGRIRYGLIWSAFSMKYVMSNDHNAKLKRSFKQLLNRSHARSRAVRSHGRHVSRSFFAVVADSGGGGDDGGDGQSDSDCNRLAFAVCGKGEFGVAAVRDGQGQFGRINGIIVSRYRALPAQTRGAQGDGRFFVPFWRWAA